MKMVYISLPLDESQVIYRAKLAPGAAQTIELRLPGGAPGAPISRSVQPAAIRVAQMLFYDRGVKLLKCWIAAPRGSRLVIRLIRAAAEAVRRGSARA